MFIKYPGKSTVDEPSYASHRTLATAGGSACVPYHSQATANRLRGQQEDLEVFCIVSSYPWIDCQSDSGPYQAETPPKKKKCILGKTTAAGGRRAVYYRTQ